MAGAGYAGVWAAQLSPDDVVVAVVAVVTVAVAVSPDAVAEHGIVVWRHDEVEPVAVVVMVPEIETL